MSQIIDTRDLHERLDELEGFEEVFLEAKEALANYELDEEDPDSIEEHSDLQDAVDNAETDFGEDERKELAELRSLKAEVPEWDYGTTLIREDYFRQYAEDFADDTGAIDRRATWPLNHIDWEAAAEELKHDFSSTEFQGCTYYYQA